MNKIYNKLKQGAAEKGYIFSVVGMDHIDELIGEIENLKKEALIDKRLFKSYLHRFESVRENSIENAHSIVIFGIPQHISLVRFSYQGEEVQAVIPPAYFYTEPLENCKIILDYALKQGGYKYRLGILPLKLLAARSGLGRYGRNNIFYTEEFGSFVRLQAFITDCDLGIDRWQEKQIMPRCRSCDNCRTICPTGCIDDQRILIHAHKCLTFFNESESPFPDWLDPKGHNSLVGCMKCQELCPQNQKYLKKRGIVESFSDVETELMLNNSPFDSLPDSLKQKIQKLDMKYFYSVLGRNLKVLGN